MVMSALTASDKRAPASKVVYEYDWADGNEYTEYLMIYTLNEAVRAALANVGQVHRPSYGRDRR